MNSSGAALLLAALCASTFAAGTSAEGLTFGKQTYPFDRHNFAPLPTLVPLPPIPPLPALPTATAAAASPATVLVEQRAPLVQVHPSPPLTKVVQQYRVPLVQATPSSPAPVFHTAGPQSSAVPSTVETVILSYRKPTLVTFPNTVAPSPSNTVPLSTSSTGTLSTTTNNNKLLLGLAGRPSHHYDVMEIIDNDIEREPTPRVVNTPFIDGYRAHYGSSFGSTINDLTLLTNDLERIQQRLNNRLMNPTDTVALGSGGLGFVRLPNGNVFLGSGSLGYISGRQHNQSVAEARTRAENSLPDPLHFGHGPRTLPSNVAPIVLRFRP